MLVTGNLMRALRLTVLTVAIVLMSVFALPLLLAGPGPDRSMPQQTERVPAYPDLRRLVGSGRQVIDYTMREDRDTILTCLDEQ